MILDDPVQAMDPANVDGLVTVLSRIAKDRQVVVFSHDDRLADAVRRAAVDATILEVAREAGSKVVVNDNLDPASRYLRDAFAMVMDDGLPDPTLRRLLPGCSGSRSSPPPAIVTSPPNSPVGPAQSRSRAPGNSTARPGSACPSRYTGTTRPSNPGLPKRGTAGGHSGALTVGSAQ